MMIFTKCGTVGPASRKSLKGCGSGRFVHETFLCLKTLLSDPG